MHDIIFLRPLLTLSLYQQSRRHFVRSQFCPSRTLSLSLPPSHSSLFLFPSQIITSLLSPLLGPLSSHSLALCLSLSHSLIFISLTFLSHLSFASLFSLPSFLSSASYHIPFTTSCYYPSLLSSLSPLPSLVSSFLHRSNPKKLFFFIFILTHTVHTPLHCYFFPPILPILILFISLPFSRLSRQPYRTKKKTQKR